MVFGHIQFYQFTERNKQLAISKLVRCYAKTAWHLNHRIRVMLTDKAPELLKGIVEIDETYVGGSLRNIHAKKKEKLKGLDNKTIVFGAVQRGGKVRTKVVPQTNLENVSEAIENFVAPDSTTRTSCL